MAGISGERFQCPPPLLPERFEFWQNMPFRLHDRTLYQRDAAGAWLKKYCEGTPPPTVDQPKRWSYLSGVIDAHLVLAEGNRLEPHDVLLLPTTPALAILDACRAGPSATRHGGISLVEALLARGTRAVLAAPHDLDDRSATVLAARLYAHLAGDPDLPRAFSQAYAALWREGPSPALTQAERFRVWVP